MGRQKALANSKGANPEDIEKGMEIFKRFFWVGLIAGIMLSYAILGAIGALIGAALTKKDPRPIDDINQIGQ